MKLKDKYKTLEEKIDSIRTRETADLGDKDLSKIRELDRQWEECKSSGLQLIESAWNPFKFLTGVKKYAYGRVLEAFASHNILHGQYDLLEEEKYWSSVWDFRGPVDEASWKRGHNGLHHTDTNVLGSDIDLNHGILRVDHGIPWDKFHLIQIPLYLIFMYPKFLEKFNSQMMGTVEFYRNKLLREGNRGYALTHPEQRELTKKELIKANVKSEKIIRSWKKENIDNVAKRSKSSTWKVKFGLRLAEIITNYEIAMTIQPTHQAEEKYPEGYVPKSKGEWYFMQMETTRNYELDDQERLDYYGGLNYQIEHHLFPDLPHWRYMHIAREIKDLCEQLGIEYRHDSTRHQTFVRFVKEAAKYSIPDFFRHKLFGKSKLESQEDKA